MKTLPKSEPPQLSVIYEDNHLLVVDKPAGMLSQSDRPDASDDLLSLARQYIKIKYNKPGDVWLGLVHRLDRDVGGVMILARTSKAAARLSKEIREGRTGKWYRALTVAEPQLTPGDQNETNQRTTLNDRLAKDTKQRMAYSSTKDGKASRLHYRILKKAPDGSCDLEIELETGRFHQIRFQLGSRQAAILGDRKYGTAPAPEGLRLALHCIRMTVRHPVRQDEQMDFESPLPATWPAL